MASIFRKSTLTFGADPEFFLVEKTGDQRRFVPAGEVISGTKTSGVALKCGASYHVDGLALEITVPPQNTFEKVRAKVGEAVAEIKRDILPPEVYFYNQDTVYFKDFHARNTNIKKEYLEVGCSPAYVFRNNEVQRMSVTKKDIEDCGLYTAGGHIHFGWTKKGESADVEDPEYISACGSFINSLSFYSKFCMSGSRKNSPYNDPTSFRPKPYGVEMRCPSNIWAIYSIEKLRYYNSVSTVVNQAKYQYRKLRRNHIEKYGE